MDRRRFAQRTAALVLGAWSGAALAQPSGLEATQGLKAALERGANLAIDQLGKPDGFLGNPKLRIPLPKHLQDAAKLMRTLGRGAQVDELELSINRGAEAALPLARDLMRQTIAQLSVGDALQILRGGDQSVTDFFASKTRAPLTEKFIPIVARATAKLDLAKKYNRVASKAAAAGLVSAEDAQIEPYVARRALDGLYALVAEEERRIRQNPVATGSAILKKVFGALK